MTDPAPNASLLLAQVVRHALERPRVLAVREASTGRTLCWRELADAVRDVARSIGTSDGSEVVLVVAPNCIELLVSLLAGLACGATVAPLSPELPERQLRAIAERVRARTILGDDAATAAVAKSMDLRWLWLREALAPSARGRAFDASPRGSLVLATSGTTGVPKLVRRRAAALDAVGVRTAAAIGIRPDDCLLLAIPLHHSYGIDQGLVTAMIAGCAIELHDGFSLPHVHASLRAGAVTILPGVPYMLDVLARSRRDDIAPTGLRRVVSAGGPLPRAIFEEFATRFGVRPGQIYGATEFGSVTYGDPDAPDFEPDSAGRAFEGTEIRIVDPRGADAVALPVGAEGQVAIAGPSLFAEYIGQTDKRLRDGFFLTDDLGRIDAAGRLWLSGRSSLLIDVGGRKVNPMEVEAVLESHRGVAAAAVIAIPFSRTVLRLKAIVVPAEAEGPSHDELRRFLRQRLEPYKIPRSFETRASLPRTPTGKLLREQLIAGANAAEPASGT